MFNQVSKHGNPRDVGLDALRGFAILLVVVHHVGLSFPSAESSVLTRFLISIGWGGVDLFFAISGFLITGILLKTTDGADIKGFFIKRIFRIVPLYLAALSLFFLGSVFLGHDKEIIDRIWINVLFLTAWAIPFLGENGVPYTITWSVSVEETAYIVFGFAALFGARAFRLALICIVFFAFLVRVIFVMLGFEPETIYYFAPGRLDAIALGGLAAVFLSSPARTNWRQVTVLMVSILVGLGILSGWSRSNAFVAMFGYSAIGVLAAWLVVSVSRLRCGDRALPVNLFGRLGLVSYFVYLFHGFVIAAVKILFPQASDWSVEMLTVLVVLLTYLPAMLSWRFFEQPLIQLGRRLSEVRRAKAAALQ
ncbi:acyltransferase family protein [Arenimonas caeni]|nr:acyltransferase [Arenimonas caeni]